MARRPATADRSMRPPSCDVAIVGAGAAGLATAIFTRRFNPPASGVVLATGGRALPKSGSDGAGYEFARRAGHTIVEPTPALVPLLLAPEDTVHRDVSGVAHDVELTVRVDGAVAIRLAGALLWTHFGISGPVVLNASRHWLRAQLEGR